MMVREDFAGARKALADANKLKPNDLLIHRALCSCSRVNPQAGPEEGHENVETAWPTSSRTRSTLLADLRLDKADILMAMKKDDLRAELARLVRGN